MNVPFDHKAVTGLSQSQADELLRRHGPNSLPSSGPRSVFSIAWEVVREPMFLLLVAGATLYFILGEPKEASMLLGFVVVVMGITLYQERKTERALEALRDLSSPRALVIRDGVERRIAGRDVVPGDILVLAEGDRVPADARLIYALNLSLDESLVTGEAVPVRKDVSNDEALVARPGGDDTPFVFSGTLVVSGKGFARVTATGPGTAIGRIGDALARVEQAQTPLQKETARLVRLLAVAGLSACAVVVLTFGIARQDWVSGLLAGITLAMALLPEEFPVVLTIFLALGAWRISRHRVLTRRVATVETLGAATVLCVDKTGTLTENRMKVSRLWTRGQTFSLDKAPQQNVEIPEDFHELVEFSILASQLDPFDPMEKAIHAVGDTHLAQTEHIHKDWTLQHQYPLCPKLLAMSHVWKSPDGRSFVIAAKGAPEAIADLCHFDQKANNDMCSAVEALASQGMRVLGVARSTFALEDLPDAQHDFDFEFVGLIALSDPVRESVAQAVAECHAAGIRVVMITGDYSATAKHIAAATGLANPDVAITGPELEAMAEDELRQRVRTCNVYCRVVPEQKLLLVQALKANGEIVAMTGDGVNDAPAIKAAHIGIAMGGRGTDVAREASDLVLLDDDFSSIVAAVRMGRRIFENIRKAMSYIISIHFPIAGLSLIPVVLGWNLEDLLLMPVHIMFLELLIDPSCSVVFEAEPAEPDSMQRPPRNPKTPLFSGSMLATSAIQGALVLAVNLGLFAIDRFLLGHTESEARAMAFTSLVLSNIGLTLANRSRTRSVLSSLSIPNKSLWLAFGATLALLAAALYIPVLRGLFHFDILHPTDLAICAGTALLGLILVETVKFFTLPHRQHIQN